VLRQHCHDIGLATYVVTLNGELFQLVVTLILIWLYLGLEPGLGLGFGLDSSGLGLGLGTCWTRYRSGVNRQSTFPLLSPITPDLVAVPASQAYVEQVFLIS